MTRRALFGVAVVAIAVALFLVFSQGQNHIRPVVIKELPKPDDPNKAPVTGVIPTSSEAPSNIIIGHGKVEGRRINTIFTTRKREIMYQALIRYEPADATWDEAPGRVDLMQMFARQGRPFPPTLKRVEQETEMVSQNLGEPLRFVTSIKYYINPYDGRVIGYDMAQTTGGQSQRMVGHLNKNGVSIEVYRGSQLADKQEITFVRDTFIPVEFEFLHQWYQVPANAEARMKREQVKFSVFIPEAMTQVLLLVKPMDDERISVNDATYYCARYEVLTVSTQSAEGLFARQEMWFDKESGRMMRRQDFDASLEMADASVTEREPYQRVEELKRLSELPVTPPAVPYKSAEFLLDNDWNYSVNAGEKSLGRVRVHFSRYAPGSSEPPFLPGDKKAPVSTAYFSKAIVDMDTGGTLRDETAVTLFDDKWNPLAYEARGTEKAGIRLTYNLATRISGGRIEVRSVRDPVVEMKYSTLHTAAMVGFELGTRQSASGSDWRDPMQRVPINDDEASAQEEEKAPRLSTQEWTRAFPDGTFISDYNRLEHLALLACRLPLPPPPPPENATPAPDAKPTPLKVAFQKAAIYLIRQNRCGVILFEMRNEYKPRLTERQKKRLTEEDLKEPPLFVASANAAMMPCKMLLTPEGRLLELTMKYGSGDVTFTLDDPIMRRRAERARVQKLQEGPRLVRPPWY